MQEPNVTNASINVERIKRFRTILPKTCEVASVVHRSGSLPTTTAPATGRMSTVSRYYRCYNCVAVFTGFRGLRRHLQEEHGQQLAGTTAVFICPYCHLCWNSHDRFQKHIMLNHSSKHCIKIHQDNTIKYYCGECDNLKVALATHLEIEKHFMSHHGRELNADHPFEFNDGQFDDFNMEIEFLDDMLLAYENDVSLQFDDYLTDLDFTFPEILQMEHDYLPSDLNGKDIIVPITEPTAAFPCPKCIGIGIQENSFRRPHQLMKHLIAHHNYPMAMKTSDKEALLLRNGDTHQIFSYPCPYCDKTFVQMVKLRQHLRIVHSQYKKHICQLCDRKFSTLDHLKKHVLSQHQNERKYCCQICDKRFTQSSHLQQHVLIHSSDKKFACMNCNKKFWRKIDLTRHTVKIHT